MSSERPLDELDPELLEKLGQVKENNQKRIQAEGRRSRESYLPIFRAWAIVGAITGGLLASEKADIGPSDIVNWGIDIVENLNGPTEEQKKAGFLFRTAPESSFVHDLVAIGDVDENGKRIPVNLRNRPSTKRSLPAEDINFKDGEDVGDLPLDFKIDKALLALGENPSFDGHRESIWLIVMDNKGDAYFVYSRAGIVGLADKVAAPVYDIQEVELP